MALVTGGSRGLGKEMVLALARAGADVTITSRKVESCKAVAEEVRETTGRRAFVHRVPRRALGRARRARRRHLRRARPGRHPRQQRRDVAAVPGPRKRLGGAVRQGRRRQLQGPLPARRPRRRPHGRGRRWLDHQRQQRRRDPADAAASCRTARPRPPSRRSPSASPRPMARRCGSTRSSAVRSSPTSRRRGTSIRPPRCSAPMPWAGAASPTRSSAPRSTWRATHRAS